MKTLLFSLAGAERLEEALIYYERSEEGRTMGGYLQQVEAAFERIRTFPELRQVVRTSPRTGFDYRSVTVWRFVFFYRVTSDAIVVEEVAHESSDLSRLSDL